MEYVDSSLICYRNDWHTLLMNRENALGNIMKVKKSIKSNIGLKKEE